MDSEKKNKRLREALSRHGEQMSGRVAWLQTMIERQQKIILNGQEAIEGFRQQLEAANIALDALRAEYKVMLESSKDDEE